MMAMLVTMMVMMTSCTNTLGSHSGAQLSNKNLENFEDKGKLQCAQISSGGSGGLPESSPAATQF